jgi:hypothetical protein
VCAHTTRTQHARSGGQRYALRERIVYIGPAPPPPSPPPAPWYDAPPAPARPSWLGSAAPPGFQEEHTLRLPMQGTSTPLWDSLTFDPFFKLVWIGLDGDGLAFLDTKVSFMQLRWHQSLKANHVTIIPDGQGWVSSVADAAAVLINTWLSPGDELMRVPLGIGARASAYDSATSSAAFVLTNGSVTVLASPSGARRGTVDLRARGARASEHALQSPRCDGAGNVYVAMPYDNKIAKINLRTSPPTLVTTWNTRPCFYPTGMDIDVANGRLFVGCAVRSAHHNLSRGVRISHVHALAPAPASAPGRGGAHAGGAGHG